jgi:hypothetical protein
MTVPYIAKIREIIVALAWDKPDAAGVEDIQALPLDVSTLPFVPGDTPAIAPLLLTNACPVVDVPTPPPTFTKSEPFHARIALPDVGTTTPVVGPAPLTVTVYVADVLITT